MNNIKKWFTRHLSEALLVFLSLVLIIFWFKDKQLILSGEEIFSVVNPYKTLTTHLHPWFVLTEQGLPSTRFYLPRLTYFTLASLLSSCNVPNWLVQALTYFFLCSLGTIGVSLLFRKMFVKKTGQFSSFYAGMFYLLNTFSMTQVWGRFILSGMFAWSLLPWTVLFYYQWLVENNIKSVLFFVIFSLLLSHSFGNPGFAIAIFSPIIVLTLVEVFKRPATIKNRINIIVKFSVFIIFWIVSNIWWLYPHLFGVRSAFSEISQANANYNTLIGLSSRYSLIDVFLLKWGLGEGGKFAVMYKSVWLSLLNIFALLISIIGWIYIKRNKNWLFLSILGFVGFFIVKGINPPIGKWFYDVFFKFFPWIAGSLRNPFEKFGIVWLLPYSIFFGAGILWIQNRFRKWSKPIVYTIALLVCGWLVLPFWTGGLFGGCCYQAKVVVPAYYQIADHYVSRNESSKIFFLPYLPGDSVRYLWGFEGLEPSEFLFGNPSISKILRVKYFDDYYLGLEKHLGNVSFPKLLGVYGIDKIILRKDIDDSVYVSSSHANSQKYY